MHKNIQELPKYDVTALNNIRKRRKEREESMKNPPEECHKCGHTSWDKDIEPGTWYCFCCGNLAYFNGSGYTQQCDLVKCNT